LVQPQTSQTPERAPEPQPAAQTEPSNAEGNGKGQRVEPKPEVKREQEELTKTPIPTPPIDKVEVKETVTTNIQYLKEDSYVYKDQNEKSQRTWLLKKGQEFSSTNANAGWVAVTTKDGKKGFVREEVLTSNKP